MYKVVWVGMLVVICCLPLRYGEVLLLIPMPVWRRDERVLIIWEVAVCVWFVENLHLADASAGFWDEPRGCAGAVVEGELFLLGEWRPFELGGHFDGGRGRAVKRLLGMGGAS